MSKPDPHAPIFERCPRRFRRKGETVICGATVREVRSVAGKVLCFVCNGCGRHYSPQGEAL